MATAALLAPAGCSLGGDEEPPTVTGAAREIAEVVDQLERATVRRDWETVCSDLFTKAALERAGGADCERLMRSTAKGIERPQIRVRSIQVEAERATVQVRSSARGEAALGHPRAPARAGRVAGRGAGGLAPPAHWRHSRRPSPRGRASTNAWQQKPKMRITSRASTAPSDRTAP